MNSKQQKPGKPWALSVLFYVVSAVIISFGIVFYVLQKRDLLKERVLQLSTIADLKIKQITEWRRERIGDGLFLSENVSTLRQFSELLRNPGDKQLRHDLKAVLESLTANYDYRNALFLDKECNVILFHPNQDTIIGDYLKGKLPDAINRGEVVLTDLHQTGKVSFVHLDLLVPLTEPGASEAFGILVLRIDPHQVLYPIIKSWPVMSKTSESFLFHSEGDEIVYLNELRHRENSELLLRMPVNRDKLPASQALKGMQNTTDGIDYRGVEVIAVMKKVPQTPWYMVAKVDRQEAMAGLYRQGRLTALVVVLLVMITGFLISFIIRNQRVRFYRTKYESEVERLALVRHYDYILKNANDIIILFDADYLIVEANDRAVETYRYDRNELIGQSVRMLRSDATVQNMEEDLKELNKSGTSTYETIHKRKDGTTFPIEISARKFEIEGVTYIQSISRDITERKNADETLRESEERFRKLFEESPLGMVMTGKDMGIVRANSAFCKMIGYTEEEIFGMTFRNFTHPDNIGPDEVGIFLLVAKKIPIYRTEKKYIRSNGSVIWGAVTVTLIRNKKDEVQFLFAMIEDITARKAAEAELIAAKEKAEESDRLKTAFLHNVSHEIRTPMNAILGFTTLLNEPGITAEDRSQFTDVIFQSGNQLLMIINDIVDLASIESGQMKVSIRQINLNTTLRRLGEQFSYKEKPDKIALVLETPLPQSDAEIITDNTKLVQIISNLINNAFKFTKKGKIIFGYNIKGEFIEFFVKDSGIGIAPEHQSKIFERFYQVDSAVSRKYGGTGLGLSICKAYTELLGGKIWLESAPGEGTSFYFTIPYTRGAGESSPALTQL